MFKGIWNQLKNDMSDGTNVLPTSKVPKLIINFDPTENEINKLVQETPSYGLNFTDKYEVQVSKIVDNFYNDIDKLKVDRYKLEYKSDDKKPNVWVGNQDNDYKITLYVKGEKLEMYMSRKQVARVKFLLRQIKKNQYEQKMKNLNDMLEIKNEPVVTQILSRDGHKINITQADIIESLKITHPQHFI